MSSLSSLVPAGWRGALAAQLAAPSFQALEAFLAAEEKQATVLPPREQIFAALAETPLEEVKVVIIGQDPYPTAGNANGLAFSVSPGVKVPASLRNIFTALSQELGLASPTSGDLTPWARRGVLLLNTVLTVSEGKPNSHKKKGWEPFTEAVLAQVSAQRGPVVFLCLGAQALAMAEALVDAKRHAVLAAPHPSPLNGNKFVVAAVREKLFGQVNEVLVQSGRGAVDWSLP